MLYANFMHCKKENLVEACAKWVICLDFQINLSEVEVTEKGGYGRKMKEDVSVCMRLLKLKFLYEPVTYD